MGNSENEYCQSSYYLCNLFPVKSKTIRKSSLNIINNTKNSFGTNKPISGQSEKESGEFINISRNLNNILKSNQTQNKSFSKFFLINPSKNKNDVGNNRTVFLKERQKKVAFINKNHSCLNINNKKQLNKNNHKLKNRKNFGENENIKKKLNIESEMNKSSDEETIINNSLIDNSFKYIVDSSKTQQKRIKEKKKNINKTIKLENKINKLNKIKEIKESEEFSGAGKSNKNEQEINCFQGSLNTSQSKDSFKYQKNLIKGLKDHNFKYSLWPMIKAHRSHKIQTIKETKRPTLKRIDSNIRNILDVKPSNVSIPQARHLDPDHPLNYLILNRQIKSSLYPLNKNTFNIINFKEDKSQLYSFFKNGAANGVTKYIMSKKKNIIYEGEFENGFPKGYGKYTISNEGRSYEGIWNKEIKIGIETWKDGTIFMGNFKNNKKDGVGIYRWNDGTIYYGEWKNNNMDGYCYINYADDKIYEGEMMNGTKNGYGEFTWKPIRKYIGYYVNDLKEGFGIYIWNIKTFQIYVGFWNKGKMEGIGMMINGKKIYYGKWSKGVKIEQFKNKRDLKLKYKSTDLKMASGLINNLVNNAIKKNTRNEAKIQLEKCINLMCNDYNEIKNFIINIFIKTNESLKEK